MPVRVLQVALGVTAQANAGSRAPCATMHSMRRTPCARGGQRRPAVCPASYKSACSSTVRGLNMTGDIISDARLASWTTRSARTCHSLVIRETTKLVNRRVCQLRTSATQEMFKAHAGGAQLFCTQLQRVQRRANTQPADSVPTLRDSHRTLKSMQQRIAHSPRLGACANTCSAFIHMQ